MPGGPKSAQKRFEAASSPNIARKTASKDFSERFCGFGCPKSLHFKCEVCVNSVKTAYTHPEWAGSTGQSILEGIDTSGGGQVKLSVIGMHGIYAFCGAVILSILLSLVVDVYDNRAKKAIEQEEESTSSGGLSLSPIQLEDDGTSGVALLTADSLSSNAEAAPTNGVAANGHIFDVDSRDANHYSVSRIILTVLAVLVMALVILAASMITFKRKVNGAIPTLLHDILAIGWGKTYSLTTLALTTGEAGGWDLLLMATISLFIVVGPVVRSILTVASFATPNVPRAVLSSISFIGAFCAFEVFIVAAIMVDLLMPSITSTLIIDGRCAQISEDGSCFNVEFDIIKTFLLVVIGGSLLVVLSAVAVHFGLLEQRKEYRRRVALTPNDASFV